MVKEKNIKVETEVGTGEEAVIIGSRIDLDLISTKGDIFTKFIDSRVKSADVYEGSDAVKAKTVKYLPLIPGQDPDMYAAYLQRARFFNVFKRTIGGLKGLVARKESKQYIGDIEPVIIDDITLTGMDLNEYAFNVLTEVLKTGLCATLVDYPTVDAEITIAEKEVQNIRPNFVLFKGEQLINVDYITIDGIQYLSLAVFEQTIAKTINVFEKKSAKRYVVLMLDAIDGKYQYRQVEAEEVDGSVILTKDLWPKIDGAPITRIPLYIHGHFDYPPMYDLVDTNIYHFQLKADHNHCLHYIGLPTPIFPGIDPNDKDKPKGLGPSRICYISDPAAKPFFLELEGKGLEYVKDELAKLEEDMAYLGALLLISDKMRNETATKTEIRNTTETANLVDIVMNISQTITQALQFLAEWEGSFSPDILFALNTDYNPAGMTPQEVVSHVQTWQSGVISKRTLYRNLQDGEVAMADRSFEEEQELIQNGE